MNRRGFLSLLGTGVVGGVFGIAIDQAIPLGRVWSFPKKIVLPEYLSPFDSDYEPAFKVGSTIRVRIPQRFIVRDWIGDFSREPDFVEGTVISIRDVTADVHLDSSRTPS